MAWKEALEQAARKRAEEEKRRKNAEVLAKAKEEACARKEADKEKERARKEAAAEAKHEAAERAKKATAATFEFVMNEFVKDFMGDRAAETIEAGMEANGVAAESEGGPPADAMLSRGI